MLVTKCSPHNFNYYTFKTKALKDSKARYSETASTQIIARKRKDYIDKNNNIFNTTYEGSLIRHVIKLSYMIGTKKSSL